MYFYLIFGGTWTFRGTAGETGWYECPRWPGQVNLYLLQSIHGIEHYIIYDNNMKLQDYKQILPVIGRKMREAAIDGKFSCYVHDNLWRGAEPIDDLDRHIGKGRYTRYMGKPCTKPHPTERTPIRKIPTRLAKRRCDCIFPNGPIHASFNPKMNLIEETFAKIDRQMTLNKRTDAVEGIVWPTTQCTWFGVFE